MISENDFKNSVPSGGKSVSKAVFSNGFIYAATAQPRGFSIISTQSKKVVSRIEDKRLIGGMFAGDGTDLYLPINYKLFRVNENGSTQLLKEYAEDMFGVIDVQLADSFLFVRAHNGVYVFDRQSETLLQSFKNTNKNTVSPLSFRFNPDSGKLFVLNLRDSLDDRSIVLCADSKNDFDELWRVKLDGQLGISNQEPGFKAFHETDSMLILPLRPTNSEVSNLIWLDKNTGKVEKSFEYRNGTVLFEEDRIYFENFRQNQVAAIDLETLTILWTSDLDSTRKFGMNGIRDKLYLYRKDKKTWIINKLDGKTGLRDGAVNAGAIFNENLSLSNRFFAVNGSICWD